MADSVRPSLPQFRGGSAIKLSQEEGEEAVPDKLLQAEGVRLGLVGLKVLVQSGKGRCPRQGWPQGSRVTQGMVVSL